MRHGLSKVWASALLLSLSAAFSAACLELDPDDGGGGGSTEVNFQQGFVFIRRGEDHVFIADRANFQNVRRLAGEAKYRQPSLNQAGTQAVFVRVTGTDTSLQTVATNGGATPATVFSSDGSRTNFRNPVFSPDGQTIVFAYDEGGASKIGRITSAGLDFAELTGGSPSKASPSFYPDGNSVLVMGGSTSANYTSLEKLSLTGGAPQTILNNLGSAEAVSVENRLVISPDGSKAAFDARTASAQKRIFVFDLTTKSATQLSDTGVSANDTFPAWVGNTELSFSSDSGGADQVYVISAAGPKGSGTLTLTTANEPWFGP